MIASISDGLLRSAMRRKCRATLTIADRTAASSLGAELADFSRAIRANGRVAGDVTSAGDPGTNESPVTAPPAPRLTSAVACCHRGLGAGRNCYTSWRMIWAHAGFRAVYPDDLDRARALRMAMTCGFPGSFAC